MLLGTHTPKLDDKGRVILPAKFREDLAGGIVVTRGQERCLYVFSTAEFEGETVLYDAAVCRPVLLNVSAAAVWATIDGRRSVAEIAASVAAAFGADPAAVMPDVTATVARFEALGLLTVSPP